MMMGDHQQQLEWKVNGGGTREMEMKNQAEKGYAKGKGGEGECKGGKRVSGEDKQNGPGTIKCRQGTEAVYG